MRLIYQILGYGSLGGAFACIFALVNSLMSSDLFVRDRNGEIFIGGFVAITIGLLVMILDLNFFRGMTESERDIWRSKLWWRGPFAAAQYFLQRASSRV